MSFKVKPEMAWMRKYMDLFPALKLFLAQALIIHGENDIIPKETTQKLHQAINGSQFAPLEDSGCFP